MPSMAGTRHAISHYAPGAMSSGRNAIRIQDTIGQGQANVYNALNADPLHTPLHTLALDRPGNQWNFADTESLRFNNLPILGGRAKPLWTLLAVVDHEQHFSSNPLIFNE